MDVRIVEVSPRDGLQNERALLSTAAKVELITRLVGAGLRRIEAVSFAHPKVVPAMADAEAVLAAIPRPAGVSYAGLVLNQRGLDRALATELDEVNVVVAASDTFSRRNQNVDTDGAMRTAVAVLGTARDAGKLATLTISTAFGCPFEGEVAAARVLDLAVAGAQAGAGEICFGDTVGVGVPAQVTALAEGAARRGLAVPLRFHFHNTRNTGYANAMAAIQAGAPVLDASAGGVGGCPFAPAATGNVATEDLAYLLERSGHRTGIDLPALLPVAGYLTEQLGHEVPALLPRAGLFPAPPAR